MAEPGQHCEDDAVNRFVQWRHALPNHWKYCPLCGAALSDRQWDGKIRRYCTQCGFVYWDRPMPATAAIIYDRASDRVVVVTRRYPPAVGGHTFPGGGIEAGEGVTEALLREVREETGLTVVVDAQLGTWSTPSKETIITFFLAHPEGGQLLAGSDALDAKWFPVQAVPELVFSLHQAAFDLFSAQHRLGTL
ncbi:MAG: NUDIX domain-containing protein [Thermaerobacter sp.]|nr:NUDIX domain-containing protein [Thermaerobacter sp.]